MTDETRVYAHELLEQGGDWLGATRNYLLWHAHRGDQLTWSSYEQVKGLTVKDIEMLAAKAVAADRNERSR